MDTKESTTDSTDTMDMNFLTQFSCMGTTDHEELISQFQKIANGRLSYTTARFFLDMNNWNLPAAVGCYFDFMATSNGPRPSMVVERNLTANLIAEENVEVTLSWLLRNNGDTDWPEGCHLINIKPKSNEQADRLPQMFPVPSIKPNDTVTVNVVFKTPTYQQVLEMWNREFVKPAPYELTQEWAVCRTEWTISTADNSTTIGQVLICNVWVAKTPMHAQWLRQNGQNEQMLLQQAQQQQLSLPTMEMDDLTRCINGLPQSFQPQFFQDGGSTTQPPPPTTPQPPPQPAPNQSDDFEMS